MNILQFSTLSFLIHLFFTSITCTDTNTNMATATATNLSTDIADCPTQVCSFDDPISRNIQFPFQIRNESLPIFCAYPGFDLLCDGSYKLLIDLPSLGKFSVQAIDYIDQEIWLNDPQKCLPRRLLSMNLSTFDKSPFSPVQQLSQFYWLYNCSIGYTKSLGNVTPIPCLSGLRHDVVASPFEDTSNTSCKYLGSIQVPFGLGLGADIRLSWAEPECDACYMAKGRCGFKNYSSLKVSCFDVPPHGLRKETLVAIALAFAAPLAIFTCCITYFSHRAICFGRRNNTIDIEIPTRYTDTVTGHNGLDRSVIESYPKVVLGESRRLPKADDKSCPICLGEYLAKETLRTLPNCAHCFHAHCVDEWLEFHGTCPVCRNAPNNTLGINK